MSSFSDRSKKMQPPENLAWGDSLIFPEISEEIFDTQRRAQLQSNTILHDDLWLPRHIRDRSERIESVVAIDEVSKNFSQVLKKVKTLYGDKYLLVLCRFVAQDEYLGVLTRKYQRNWITILQLWWKEWEKKDELIAFLDSITSQWEKLQQWFSPEYFHLLELITTLVKKENSPN